jgi:hypothetical protein
MPTDHHPGRRVHRIAIALVGVTAVGALVVASAPLAGAQTGDPGGPHPRRLTDAQQTCLRQHGVTLPTPGQRPAEPPSDAQRQAFEAAAKACGLPAPPDHPGWRRRMLTDAQRTCLRQHGVTLPTPGERPSEPPSGAPLHAFAAAAQACGIPAPDHTPPSTGATGT